MAALLICTKRLRKTTTTTTTTVCYLFMSFISVFISVHFVERSSASHTQIHSEVLEAYNSCAKVWRDSCQIIQERIQSIEFVAKPFTVLVYCCLLLHMIDNSYPVELKLYSLQDKLKYFKMQLRAIFPIM